MGPESTTLRQKRRLRNVRNKYFNPDAPNQLNCSRPATRCCTDFGKKRVMESKRKAEIDNLDQNEALHESFLSPTTEDFHPATNVIQQQTQSQAPITTQTVASSEMSVLESLPIDILVKILCRLHHDHLRSVFHVCRRIRTAVILARQTHFNYTTPVRSRPKILRTGAPVPAEHLPSTCDGSGKDMSMSNPQTPEAPRQGPRPPRLYMMDMRQVSVVLFQESTSPQMSIPPQSLRMPVLQSVASPRVSLQEDELCQAVAHNKFF